MHRIETRNRSVSRGRCADFHDLRFVWLFKEERCGTRRFAERHLSGSGHFKRADFKFSGIGRGQCVFCLVSFVWCLNNRVFDQWTHRSAGGVRVRCRHIFHNLFTCALFFTVGWKQKTVNDVIKMLRMLSFQVCVLSRNGGGGGGGNKRTR